MEEKRKEVRPKVLRRKISVPHYDVGGIVAPQGGLFGDIANQFTTTNGYNATLAPISQANYQPTMDAAQSNALSGFGTFNQNVGDQRALASALRGVANGTGPNPAAAMLNNATGANVAAQAALMAGQRGASANPGLIARQAAMAGSAAQQNAAGQAAALQAQQSLNAMNQEGSVLNSIGNQNVAEQNANANLFNSAAGANNAQNNSIIQNYNNMQSLNQQTSQNNTNAVNKTEGGLLNGIGGAVTSIFGLAKGGMVPDHLRHVHACYYADGGEVMPSTSTATSTATNTGTSVQDRTRKSMEDLFYTKSDIIQDKTPSKIAVDSYADGGAVAPDFKGVQAKIGNWAMDGQTARQIDAQRVNADPRNAAPEALLPADVKTVAAPDYRSGGPVPGRARVAGDSLKNDTQPAMLSPGEIVLPRHITQSKDAPEKAKEFVEALLKKQGHGNSTHYKEFHKALRQAILNRKTRSGA